MTPAAPEHLPALIPPAFADALRDRAAEGPGSIAIDGAAWLRGLPGLVAESLERWSLTLDPDEATRHGHCAIVVPVLRTDHTGDAARAVLKVTWPHPEAEHEHLALTAWGGRGAVRLLAAWPARYTLLLERLDPARSLADEPVAEACARLGELLRLLDRPAPPQVTALDPAAIARDTHDAPGVPRRFVDQARALLRDLGATPLGPSRLSRPARPSSSPSPPRLVHGDLHFANVLARPRRDSPPEWVAIDPKPLAGDPAYAVAPVLWNRWREAEDSGDVRWHLRCRLGWVCEAAGLDEDRARAWAIVRAVRMLTGIVRSGQHNPAAPDLPTRLVTVLKALQPE